MNMIADAFLKEVKKETNSYIKNIDSLIGMSSIPDNHIDLVLTDPPYNIADAGKLTKIGNKVVSNKEAWGNDFQDKWETLDQYYEWLKPFISEYVRVMKDNGSMILFLDRKYTGLITHYIERDFDLNFKNKIYFHKNNPLPHMRKNNYRSSIEEAVWFTKSKQYQFNFGIQSEMTQVYKGNIGHGKNTKHPTEKYSWMIEPLIKNHTKEGDVILDSFSGSGAIVYQALKTNRKAIGFEKSKKFYDMSKQHITSKQLSINFE
ncbi:site-specific DNA-methyltransferase (adenine-specific) [Methylophilus rhizosphaerae]|uniref:Methyltransferase n=1 Tax=Methylophilus rhizosphaerae TaxID=492660 RepID=A0A1G9ABU8_9PROT|nr:site-specific DNA-methyltransferase [Methylophilus rhizosphaerae]SDK24010.1 site-specific DNA-methyltransferase (adenine-specific) [Methylophilus rhizosphaerae]